MFSSIRHVARHLTRPLPNQAHTSAAVFASNTPTHGLTMASSTVSPAERNSRTIYTAACLIIGDEVLGGKTKDTNSNFFAQWCFKQGITLKKIEVISDNQGEIIEAVRRMSNGYDMVVTSGGIGPTHDDITYESIAKAFDLPIVLHEKTKQLMIEKAKRDFNWDVPSDARDAKLKMARLPTDPNIEDPKQVLYPGPEDMWVPVSVVNGNVYILPGVPRLFEALIDGLQTILAPHIPSETNHRVSIATPMSESAIAKYLTDLTNSVEPKGVKVGSYPRWGKSWNIVTLVGKNKEFIDSIVPKVADYVSGHLVTDDANDPDLAEDGENIEAKVEAK
ncbi:MoaB/Mog domain-containing protein [Bombardia bombarda]|uniref:MoaB/Mog domain-containing protein n=1 Tax=Bombardia bombarda TaxID=252184 RepID=A0AA40CGZ6_9PEZI|nr:MoaB/Mog domain-containing protein [Bombardia bombarda]